MNTMRAQRGVSLVELVVVLTIMGLIASLSATLVTRIASSQQANRDRLTLAQTADAAISRVGDELQAALPNSVRVSANAGGTWIEWVPVRDAARWRRSADSTAPGSDALDISDASDAGFDVIGTALASLDADSQLVVRNLGTPEADVYAGNNRRSGLVRSASGRHLSFTAAGALPQSTDSARAFIASTPVTLGCVPEATGTGTNTWQLRRYSGYGWLATQPDSLTALGSASSALLLGGLSSCAASYSSALANIGMLTLRFTLGVAGSGASLDVLHQLPLDNTP